MLSALIAFIFSFFLNFFFAGLLEGPFVSGFPISVANATGIGDLIARVVNTLVIGGLLTAPIYYLFLWFINGRNRY